MKTLKILDWPQQRFYSETHPFHRWRNQLKEYGLQVKCYHNHLNKELKDADYLIIHSRYFDKGKNIVTGCRQNQEELIGYLSGIRKTTGKLIWFDASDSTGSSDFPLISHVDVFLKKQLLKNKGYYTAQNSNNDLRIWLNSPDAVTVHPFKPCPADQLHKLKLGWNLGLNDYRYFGYKLSRLSNFLSYRFYPVKFSSVKSARPLDLTFRGSIHDENGQYRVSEQRNIVLKLLKDFNGNIASGISISKKKYWKELRNSKLSISPYGWREICYRDFETFISGALLVKPSMEHLETYPDVFKPNETYVPVSWSLDDLPEKLDHLMTNFSDYRQIAENGQQRYKEVISDSETFVNIVFNTIH